MNMNIYTEKLSRTLYDKLFFVDKLPGHVDAIVDFGCADGALIKAAKTFLPDVDFYGYDTNDEMLCRCVDNNVPAILFDTWSEWEQVHREKYSCPAILLSSVIHEVYHYKSHLSEIELFWNRVMSFPFIIVRDMFLPDVSRLEFCTHSRRIREADPESYWDFQKQWGDSSTKAAMIHYLLKWPHRGTQFSNWKREVSENYLPISWEELNEKFYVECAATVYEEHRTLPYLRELWKNELGVTINTPTHGKLIVDMS